MPTMHCAPRALVPYPGPRPGPPSLGLQQRDHFIAQLASNCTITPLRWYFHLAFERDRGIDGQSLLIHGECVGPELQGDAFERIEGHAGKGAGLQRDRAIRRECDRGIGEGRRPDLTSA